jgi:hypothetical protein
LALVFTVALFIHISTALRVVVTKPGAHFVACALHVPAIVGAIAISAVAATAVAVFVTVGH